MTGPRIGYLLPTRDLAVRDERELGPLIRQARLAERLGFDSVWAGDSPVTRPRADPLMVLAAVAAATERITLGTAVLLAGLRHPVLLAHQLATLDRISEGRLIMRPGRRVPARQHRGAVHRGRHRLRTPGQPPDGVHRGDATAVDPGGRPRSRDATSTSAK